MKSPIQKRSVVLSGHSTSISLEEEFWSALKEIAALSEMTLYELIGDIDNKPKMGNLSSAVRLFVLGYYQSRQPTTE